MNVILQLRTIVLTLCLVLVSISTNAAVVRVGPGVYSEPDEGRYYNNYRVHNYEYPRQTYDAGYYYNNGYNNYGNGYGVSIGVD